MVQTEHPVKNEAQQSNIFTINTLHSTIDDMLSSNIINMACCGCGAKHSIWKHTKQTKEAKIKK